MAKDTAAKSKEDLRKEREAAEAHLDALRKEEAEYDGKRKSELRAQFEEMAQKEGYSLSDILGSGGAKGRAKGGRSKGAPKYKDPQTGKTWTGKGRQPEWYKAHIETGGKPEDLAA